MRDIAEAVSVRAAGIYHWYQSKESILLKLQDSFLDDLSDVVIEAIGNQRSPESRMAAAVRQHVVFHGLHSRAAFVTDSEIRALSPPNRAAVIAKRDAYQEMFIGLIRDGVEANVFSVSDVRIASYAILLECTGVALWFNPRGPRTLDQVAETHIELVLGSLGAGRRRIVAAVHATRGFRQPGSRSTNPDPVLRA